MLSMAPRCCALLLCLSLLAGSVAPCAGAQENPPAAPVSVPEAAPAAEAREMWTGSLYSSTYSAGVCLGQDGTLRGVLLLRPPSGKVDVYHFRGTHGGGAISASHSSGHRFTGALNNNDEVHGTITLKSGFTIKLKGQRTHGVELSDTCRPPAPPE